MKYKLTLFFLNFEWRYLKIKKWWVNTTIHHFILFVQEGTKLSFVFLWFCLKGNPKGFKQWVIDRVARMKREMEEHEVIIR